MHAVQAAVGQSERCADIRDSVRRQAGPPRAAQAAQAGVEQKFAPPAPSTARPVFKRPGAGIRCFRHKVGSPQSLKTSGLAQKSARKRARRPGGPARFHQRPRSTPPSGCAKQPRALSRTAEWTSSAGRWRSWTARRGPVLSAGVGVPRRFAFAADRQVALIPSLTHDVVPTLALRSLAPSPWPGHAGAVRGPGKICRHSVPPNPSHSRRS